MITASLKNLRISPRKVRIVADMVRGKNVTIAHNILLHADKKAKSQLSTLLDSAIANAKHNFQIDSENLFVKEIRVDQGFVMKRSMPVSRGSAHPIKKRTSHVLITLAPKVEVEKVEKKPDTKKVKKTSKK